MLLHVLGGNVCCCMLQGAMCVVCLRWQCVSLGLLHGEVSGLVC